jgi:hypothetical protein
MRRYRDGVNWFRCDDCGRLMTEARFADRSAHSSRVTQAFAVGLAAMLLVRCWRRSAAPYRQAA